MDYTRSLAYARDMAKQRLNKEHTKDKLPQANQQLSFITLFNKSTMTYDVLMSTVCNRSLTFITLNKRNFGNIKWEPVVKSWLGRTFNITQMPVFDEHGNITKINTFIETLAPSGKQDGLNIEVILPSIIGQIRVHLREVARVEHGKEDRFPLWFGNETTKEHDKKVANAYSGDGNKMVRLGGNFPTTLIKEPITFEKQFVTHVGSDGEVVTVVQQDVVWRGKDGLERRYDHRMSGMLSNELLLQGPGTSEFHDFLKEAEKLYEAPVPKRVPVNKAVCSVEGFEFEM